MFQHTLPLRALIHWSDEALRQFGANLFETGYELARESAADPDYQPLKRRVARMWAISQRVDAEIDRRYNLTRRQQSRAKRTYTLISLDPNTASSTLLVGPTVCFVNDSIVTRSRAAHVLNTWRRWSRSGDYLLTTRFA